MRTVKELKLYRETLLSLETADLKQPLGGIVHSLSGAAPCFNTCPNSVTTCLG